jgi:hypothetical protein
MTTFIFGVLLFLVLVSPYVVVPIFVVWFVYAVYKEISQGNNDAVYQVVTISVQIAGDRVDIHASGNGDIPRAKDIP